METVARPSNISAAKGPVPAGAEERVIEGRRARLTADGTRRTASVAALTDEYAARRTALLGSANEAQLREYMASRRAGSDGGRNQAAEEKVAASRAFARDLGVDVVALRRLNDEYSGKVAAVADGMGSPESPMAVTPASPSAAVYTSWGSWESYYYLKYWGCPGHTPAAASYLNPPTSQNGGVAALHITNAGDNASVLSKRENGFLVEYTPPISGRLVVTAYLTCVMDDHFISTWDEWGWSSFTGKTKEVGVVETYSNWDDWTPNEEFHTTFVSGLGSTAINGGPGIVRMYLPNQTRAWAAVGNQIVPAGVSMLIYVATLQHVWADCNDVETFIGLNSAWRMTKITVNTFPG